jgi:hypothetical protein
VLEEFAIKYPNHDDEKVGLCSNFEKFLDKFKELLEKKKLKSLDEVQLLENIQIGSALCGKCNTYI